MQARRTIKLGGSLLADADWVQRFRRWLALQPPMASVLIVGGGALADVIRGWDWTYRLDAETAHWLAIDAMSMTARLVQQLLPDAKWTDSWQTLLAAASPGELTIFDPRRWLHDGEQAAAGEKLSVGWNTTSDSIAAQVAKCLKCNELVLLKSCLPASSCESLIELASSGYVDANFPRHADKLPTVRCITLRDASFAEWRTPRQGSRIK